MSVELEQAQRLLARLATSARPLICLEVNPPRGSDVTIALNRLDGQLQGVDFLNITDGALAKMRLAALPFAVMAKQRLKIEALVNLSCRDRNTIALQADLLAAWAQGIVSVVALTGDAVTVGDSPDAKGVFEVNSVGLLHLISKLNAGFALSGHELRGGTGFVPGVVVNPNAKNVGAELRRLEKKRDAGACYALSQPVFDEQTSNSFFQQAQSVGIPIMMGLLPLKSSKAAFALTGIPGIKVPETFLASLGPADESDRSQFFIEHCVKLARSNAKYVRGFHVVSGATPMLGVALARALVKERDTQ